MKKTKNTSGTEQPKDTKNSQEYRSSFTNEKKDDEQSENIHPDEHSEVLTKLLDQIQPVDFRKECELDENCKLRKNHHLVISIRKILECASRNKWGIRMNNGFVYVYNGQFWKPIDENELKRFLGRAAIKMGIEEYTALYFHFIDDLYRQFISAASFSKSPPQNNEVLINLKNGTLRITPAGVELNNFESPDFLTYQLPFSYQPDAKPIMFKQYLDKVLPEQELQNLLAEYISYIFVKTSTLKLEKVLLIYGPGANGKSVLFDVLNVLLGKENVSNYSLQNLTKYDGYQRAELANKLLNYASEISGKMETDLFKLLASGEPVEARQIYGRPFIMDDYAKLMFNVNELPREIELTHAFFRRMLIIPFNVTIPEAEQDMQLAQKIIANELPAVLNWILDGLNGILTNRRFTYSEQVEQIVKEYQKQSDSVAMFLEDGDWVQYPSMHKDLKTIYAAYKDFIDECGYYKVSIKTFSDRLKKQGFKMERKKQGMVVYAERKVHIPATPPTSATPNS